MAEARIEGAERVGEAFAFAAQAHAGQRRDSGEEYIQHPLEVAEILAEIGMDTTSLVAALLHDVVEDTTVEMAEIEGRFGPEIALLVDGVTKLSRLSFRSTEEQQAENLRKMFLAMAKDIRVIVIKLADRLHNMRTLRHLPPERREKIARETLEIYAPLAHRLGIWKIKWELEDLALRHLDPAAYYDLVEKVAMKRQEREGLIEEVRQTLARVLAEHGIKAEFQGRAKHFYSIYQKMHEQGKEFNEIFDLMALRVIVPAVSDCYEVLGLVHTLWKPVPGRFKDYIAMPKSNMYQSLHTTVIGPRGEPLEIQIRTQEMHYVAEYGIAAHWRYKEKRGGDELDLTAKIAWLRQLLEWQKEMKDAGEYMEALKVDLFADEVFVFTPKGDVKSLPKGATPVDFAYSVHTHIGHQCVGARVNGRLVPLDYELHNGDIVEIITKNTPGPSPDWLNFVKTAKAKNRIRQWLREQRRDEDIELGREMLEKELRKRTGEVHEYLKPEVLAVAAKRFGFTEADDLLAALGANKLSVGMVATHLLGEKEPETPAAPHPVERPAAGRRPGQGVKVRGVGNLLIRFARCCNPVPGDEIVGYITRGRGVTVHRQGCPSLAVQAEPERRIEVEWEPVEGVSYPANLEIEARDRVSLLSDVMNAIAEFRLNISAAKVRTAKGTAFISLTLDINHREQLENVLRRVRRVSGVEHAYRVYKGNHK
ncbi:MAG: bifunctional (p)ppGpp synthetase/guanosine-3',5'-bis(diphosphate) 3'-pyrophosphohydrolase [Firmicutes bacterium]|nr:bifunctional (p)ppGpp synthetase/guanosine-3',5'-bis(diphosphate) 3'-pyrophosphohydrolase [Bacillota bacterium]